MTAGQGLQVSAAANSALRRDEDGCMKSLVFRGPRDSRCEVVPDPVISSAGSVIVKISKCGICGSDLHPYHVGAPSTGYCIGHEAVGEVVEVGSGVSRFKVGDRVLVAGSGPCRTSRPLPAGRPKLFCP